MYKQGERLRSQDDRVFNQMGDIALLTNELEQATATIKTLTQRLDKQHSEIWFLYECLNSRVMMYDPSEDQEYGPVRLRFEQTQGRQRSDGHNSDK